MNKNQYTIKNGTKTTLITKDECEGDVTFTAVLFVGFDTQDEVALRSKTFKTQKGAEKWAMAQ